MPLLSAVYGLKWSDIQTMPQGELDEYEDQLEATVRLLYPGGIRA